MWTNAFHLVLMLVGLITLCIMGTVSAGGWNYVIEINRENERLKIFK